MAAPLVLVDGSKTAAVNAEHLAQIIGWHGDALTAGSCYGFVPGASKSKPVAAQGQEHVVPVLEEGVGIIAPALGLQRA